MDWCSIYLTPQDLSKYIYLSPPLIFPTTSTELGQKTARCESLWVLLHYVEWDRIVTLAGSKSGLRVTLSYLNLHMFFERRNLHLLIMKYTNQVNYNHRDTHTWLNIKVTTSNPKHTLLFITEMNEWIQQSTCSEYFFSQRERPHLDSVYCLKVLVWINNTVLFWIIVCNIITIVYN